MASVIVVNDQETQAKRLCRELHDRGHDTWCVADTWLGKAFSELCMLFDEDKERVFDVLALDVHWEREILGGLEVYSKLVRLGYHRQWHHTVLPTRWRIDEWTDLKDTKATTSFSPWDMVVVFAQAVGIPDDCIIEIRSRDPYDTIVNLVEELVMSGPPLRCDACGRPRE